MDIFPKCLSWVASSMQSTDLPEGPAEICTTGIAMYNRTFKTELRSRTLGHGFHSGVKLESSPQSYDCKADTLPTRPHMPSLYNSVLVFFIIHRWQIQKTTVFDSFLAFIDILAYQKM